MLKECSQSHFCQRVFVSGSADELRVTAAGSYEAAGQRVSGVKIFWFSALEVSQGPISELTESHS